MTTENPAYYFDLHAHPALKTLLDGTGESNRKDCWKNYKIRFFTKIINWISGDLLNSQSSLSQLYEGGFRIVLASTYAVEKAMVKGELPLSIWGMRNLMELTKTFGELNHVFIKDIHDGKVPYIRLLLDELQHLLNASEVNPGFKLVYDLNDIDENKLNIVLSVEGAHAFFNKLDVFDENEVLENLDKLKKSGLRIFYISLTHVTSSPLCNHAYALKFLSDKDFIPKGDGLTELGKKFIRKALNNMNEQRILIDIKHMSLKTRFQYYDLLAQEFPDVPILASHMGITGLSIKDMPVYHYKNQSYINENNEKEFEFTEVQYNKPEGYLNTKFNPWSINLYDEEIPIIIKSGGLIGLIADERVIGEKAKISTEFFSQSEFDEYTLGLPDSAPEPMPEPGGKEERRERKKSFHSTKKAIKALCNNIIHIVRVGGDEAWDYICIGSDFDGLIDALACFMNARWANKLEKKMIKFLPKIAKEADIFIEDVPGTVRKIMYDNGKNFVLKHLGNYTGPKNKEIYFPNPPAVYVPSE